MEIRSALVKLVGSVSGTWDVAAAYLGMSTNALRNRVYECKGQSLSIADALALQDLAGNKFFAQAIAAASGGTFVQLPNLGEIENDSIEAKFNQLYAEVGQLFSEFKVDVADGEIDAKERDRLTEKGESLHRSTQELLALIFSVYCPRSKRIVIRRREEG